MAMGIHCAETTYKKTSHANVNVYSVAIWERWELKRNRIVKLYYEGMWLENKQEIHEM
jgi:hypothetical protein